MTGETVTIETRAYGRAWTYSVRVVRKGERPNEWIAEIVEVFTPGLSAVGDLVSFYEREIAKGGVR